MALKSNSKFKPFKTTANKFILVFLALILILLKTFQALKSILITKVTGRLGVEVARSSGLAELWHQLIEAAYLTLEGVVSTGKYEEACQGIYFAILIAHFGR